MIFNQGMQKAGLLAFCFLWVGFVNAASNQPIESRICDDTGFAKTKIGSFAEIAKESDATYAYKVSVEELSADGLNGQAASAMARTYAYREFIKAYSKLVSPPSESAALISHGVQSVAKKCRTQTVILVWVSRSNLNWEASQSASATGDVMEQAKRMIEGGAGTSPPQRASTPPAEPKSAPPSAAPKIYIDTL
ncbi:hypothetical protein AOB54_08535 [beta proteobacterium MWH-UniP1]